MIKKFYFTFYFLYMSVEVISRYNDLSKEAQNLVNCFLENKNKDGQTFETELDIRSAYTEMEEAIAKSGVINIYDELSELFANAIQKIRQTEN